MKIDIDLKIFGEKVNGWDPFSKTGYGGVVGVGFKKVTKGSPLYRALR